MISASSLDTKPHHADEIRAPYPSSSPLWLLQYIDAKKKVDWLQSTINKEALARGFDPSEYQLLSPDRFTQFTRLITADERETLAYELEARRANPDAFILWCRYLVLHCFPCYAAWD